MGRSACGTGMVVCATILGPIVMVLLAVSFATDHWLYYDVDLSLITSPDRLTKVDVARYTTERHRGMWRECYPTNETECEYKTTHTCIEFYSVSTPPIPRTDTFTTRMEKIGRTF